MTFKRLFLIAFLIHFLAHTSFSQYSREIDSLQQFLKTSVNDTTRVNLLNDLGGYRLEAHDYNNALDDLLEGQSLAKKINYKRGLSNSIQRIGILLMNKNNYNEAMEYYVQAIQIKKEIADKKGVADVTSNMGIVYCDQGEYSKAIEKYFEALKIREEIKDYYGTGISLISIANIYYLQNNFKMALEYYFKVFKINNIVKRKYLIAEVNTNIGMTYSKLKKYSEALPYLNLAIKIDEEIGDKQGVAINLSNLGEIYLANKDYSKALEFLNKANSLLSEIGDKRGIAETLYELGNVYDSIQQTKKALKCFDSQLSLAKSINSKINVKNAYEGIARIFQKEKKYVEALNYYRLFKLMEDSIQNESVKKSVAELESKYNANKKQKEIELLKADQLFKDAQNQKQTQLILGLIAIGIIFAVVLGLLYNRNQLKKKNLLERKNFELERNALANQMNPHFIFNSLGSISGFVAENEKEKAIEYLGVFSKLIRHNLEQSREQLVSVKQEADMLKLYLHLQQLRFDNKFDFQIKLSENIGSSVALPPMFIQPYVENAVLHGVIPKTGKGTILVTFELSNSNELICEVTDDGIGIEESKTRKSVYDKKQKSLAMTIVQERKEIINSKNQQKIQIVIKENTNKAGTTVKLIFPLDYV